MKKQLRIFFLYAFLFFGPQVLMAQKNMQDSISTTTTMMALSLSINNLIVTNSGKLKIKSIDGVNIEGPFEVMLGGTLSIEIQKPDSIVFIYDRSGNRIARKSNDIEK